MTTTGRLTFILGDPLPLLNPMLRKHWSARRRELSALSRAVWEAVIVVPGQRLPAAPFKSAKITVVRRSVGSPDPDNLAASVKPLCDVLQPLTPKRKYGLGIIINDGEACLGKGVEVHAERVAHKIEQCTVVMIEGLT